MTASTAQRRRQKKLNDGHHQDRWLVSYADFITLLFAFFTMMYAISTVDAQKLDAVVQALQLAFDTKGFDGKVYDVGLSTRPTAAAIARALAGGVVPPTAPSTAPANPQKQRLLSDNGQGVIERSLNEIRSRLNERLSRELANRQVELEIDRRGLVISIREAGSFPIGSAELSPAATVLIGEVADALREVGNQVVIEGHTDDVPMRTARYASNWELSTARATTVIAYMVQDARLSPERLSAGGYAEFHPRVPNDTPENRARNRRVDIVILNPTTTAAPEPPRPGSQQ